MSLEAIADAGYVVIEPIHDPIEQPTWLQSDSNDLLTYLTPIVGPTATLIVHRAGSYFAAGDTWLRFDLLDLALTFGVSVTRSVNSPLMRALGRIDLFGFGRLDDQQPKLRVRTAIPPISRRHAERIPRYLLEDCPYIVR